MNKTSKVLLTCAALFCCTLKANAQYNDYVIILSKDTLKCKISTSLFSGSYSYKLSNEGKSFKIKPAEILEYYFARKEELFMALYKENESKPEFFKVLEKGKLLLVQQITSFTYGGGGMGNVPVTSSNQEWFIAKGSDTVKELKHSALMLSGKSRSARKDKFEEMIADNSIVLEKYKAEDKFSFKQVRQLVHLYNTGEPFKKEE